MEDDNHNNNTPSASSPPAPPQAEVSSRMQMHPKSPLTRLEFPVLLAQRGGGDAFVSKGEDEFKGENEK